MIFSFQLQGQENHLQKKVSIAFQNISLEHALKVLSEKGDFLFSYNASHIQLDRKVDNAFENEKIQSILNKLLGKGYGYTTAGKHIVIKLVKVPSSAKVDDKKQPESFTIEGFITDYNGRKLQAVNIYEIGALKLVSSNKEGFFSIPLSNNSEFVNLYINKKKYLDTVIIIKPNENKNIQIKLRPEITINDSLKPKSATIETEFNLPKLLIPENQSNLAEELAVFESRKFQFSILPAIGTNRQFSGIVTNNYSFNLLGGYAMGLQGFELGGLINLNRRDVRGVQIAGFANLTGRDSRGLQIAGFTNSNLRKVRGLQLAGFSNLALDSLNGMQLSGFMNVSGKAASGVQIAGFCNLSGDAASGVQLAGFSNISNGNIDGVQIAGFLNYNRKQSDNIQIAGFMNLANETKGIQISAFSNFNYKTLSGIQISSFLNYAKKVNGLQLGIFNVCDTIKGIPIGIISFVRKGYHTLEIGKNEQQAYTLSFKTGTHRFYNIIKAGKFEWNNNDNLSFSYGFGTQQKIYKKLKIEADYTSSILYNTVSRSVPEVLWNNLGLHFVFKVNKLISFYAGPAANIVLRENDYELPFNTNKGFASLSESSFKNVKYYGWMGYQFGIRIF